MNMVGTPCRAVQRSACTVSSTWIEALGGKDHGRAVGDGGQGAQHHAEAVVHGHRDAEAVLRAQLHGLADEVGVVHNVVVGQGGRLGRAGRAAGELDVDRIVELQLRR
jgi:hypothetical protein